MKTAWNIVAHPFKIPVGDPEFVQIYNAGCNLGKLWVAAVRTY